MNQTQMKLVRIHAFGDSNVLSLDSVPVPELRDDEVLLRVHAASVNPVDFKIRSGGYPQVGESQLPYAMGRDASGVVQRVGKNIGSVQAGAEVYAMSDMTHGTYAEYVILKADQCAVRPTSIDHAHAAAVPLAALTAWQGLFDHGELSNGQRVLIHGGAGGVGHMAVQFARHAGAHVIATASAHDIDFVRELGADEVIDYHGEPFEQLVKNLDVVYDLIGGDTRDRSFKVLRRGGILVSTLGEPSREKADEYGVRVVGYKAKPSGEQLTRIAALIDEGEVRAHIAKTFRLEEAAAAQDFLEKGHLRGKVVLVDIASTP
ncbi:NADP-dependent oxidoreductase [Rhodanobacter sp. L36]|uniref:NADP-dependent oxidoreductase n=1 Tax=Rhodanobacter sp. L36 TaxID=1747221 RepID=UPI001C2097B1|nr:NADP-dependent oxidoreductase [Rhodanobacter sp. L36]